jgi:hypothetical protein
MKYRNAILRLAAFTLLSATSASAQQDTGQVTTLTPDEYTNMILGEIEIPSSSGIFQIKSETERPYRDLSDGKLLVNSENSVGVSVPSEHEYSAAYMVFIKKLVGDITRLGTQNSVKLYSSGYDISEESALLVINVIQDINNSHKDILNDIKYQNCKAFSESLSSGDPRTAASVFMQNEDLLDVATFNYFSNVDAELAALVPSNVYSDFQDNISRMKGAVQSIKIDTNQLIEASGEDLVGFVSSRCQGRTK